MSITINHQTNAIEAVGAASTIELSAGVSLGLKVNGSSQLQIDNNGNLSMGTTTAAGNKLRVGGAISGNAVGITVRLSATAASDVTSNFYGTYSDITTTAASFTLGNLHHFRAAGRTRGAGSTITNQYGFHADSGLTEATNNYGFYSNIAAGTGRYNFYANGTADNYFAGGISDSLGKIRSIPSGSGKSSNYTLVAADNGTYIPMVTNTGSTVTVPSNVFALGDTVVIVNTLSGNMSIAQDGSMTLRFAGTASTGTRTLAGFGIATILFISSTVAIISGSGLS